MNVIIRTKLGQEYNKNIAVSEEDFIKDLSNSLWLRIEDSFGDIYLKTTEIESVIFEKE